VRPANSIAHRAGGGDQVLARVGAEATFVLEQRLGVAPPLWFEVELLGEDALQFDYHRVEEDQLEATVDRLLEKPARRSRCDEGGDQDVGVETGPQAQRRRDRSSSTKTSVSSGPIPSFSARSRL